MYVISYNVDSNSVDGGGYSWVRN